MPDAVELNPPAIRVEGFDGVGINVWDYGGGGAPLILAHCTGTHGRIWDPLVPPLLAHFHVYAYDTRGHGDSDKPEDPAAYRWSHSGDDLLAVIDQLELATGIVGAGHSAGAAHIAYAEMKRPGTFRRAVLIDPIIGPRAAFAGPNPLAEKSRHRRNRFESRKAARDRYASKPPMGTWDAAVLQAYIEHGFHELPDGTVALKCPGKTEAAVYEGSGATDVFDRLEELEFEVTLVTADGSNVRALAELQKTRFRHVAYTVLEGCSHFIPQERPEAVTDIILNALV